MILKVMKIVNIKKLKSIYSIKLILIHFTIKILKCKF